ncbi:MAG TPA: DUF2163 domain-containing protein [Xanthobacteraceae bacterium]|nr:DUF2163 domain-containing protein [Xanthobacteraceae bacterium]
MRDIPPALQAKLDSGATTLARCWVVTRSDGVVQGFTDHDRDLIVDGVVCRAGTGLTASEATQHFGLAIGGSEIGGALASDTLNEDDLAAGRYDAAAVKLFLVDWSEPELRVLLAGGVLGEVRREGLSFTAEVRGLAHRLGEETGRLYTPACSADLGDVRCKVDLTQAAFRAGGTVTAASDASSFTAAGLEAFADGWFTAGRLVWENGENAELAVEVKTHRLTDTGARLELWQAMPQLISAGDAFVVTAGCDKRFATCRDRFANTVNFRGFPHIPGNDFVIRYPVPGEPGNTGGSLGGAN